MLHLKRQDLDDILRTHHYLQEQVERNRANEQHLKHGLASEYKQIMEEKKQRKLDERKMEVEREREMIQYNERLFAMEVERRKRELQESKRVAMEELAMKESRKQREREEREREKQQFNQKVQYRHSV